MASVSASLVGGAASGPPPPPPPAARKRAGVGSGSPAVEPSQEECDQWLRRVHEVQVQRMTPEQREALAQRSEASRMNLSKVKKLKAMKGNACRSHALAKEALCQMASVAAPSASGRGGASAPANAASFADASERWERAQQASEARQQRFLQRLELNASAPARGEVRAEAEESDEDEEEAIAEVAHLVGAAPEAVASSAAVAGAAGEDAGAQALLAQLKREPGDAEECAAKFKLYEGYAEQVVKIRKALWDFYEENAPTLPPAVAQDMGRQLERIDSREAMGVPDDDGRTWFVYHMMRQAERNNRGMAGILEAFQRKLEQLSKNDQTECPICLEAFEEEGPRAAETLSCCHKLCQECWANWKRVQHGHPFCPLCRHSEFLDAVTHAAAGL